MAGKRVYITIPQRDADLIDRLATLKGQCRGQWCRVAVLVALYAALVRDLDLQDYDAELARREREEILHGRHG